MIVQINKPFSSFALNQIIDTKQHLLSDDSVNEMLQSNVISLVFDYVEKVDEVSDYLMYYGKAYGSALTTDSVWTITKTTKVGTITTREVFHNKSWDTRNVL